MHIIGRAEHILKLSKTAKARLVDTAAVMSITSQECAMCSKTGCNLFGCSKCRRVQYCGRECQKKDWPVHRQSCRILESNTMLLSVNAGTVNESTSDMIGNLNDIFNITCTERRNNAIAELILSMKKPRNSYITEKDFFGAAQTSLMLGIIDVKRNFFTDAHTRMKQCSEHMEKMYDAGAVIPDQENVTVLTKALNWNVMVAETALLKTSNDVTIEKIKIMAMGIERRDMTHKVISSLLKEQEMRMKQLMWSECLLIDMVCTGLAYEVTSTEINPATTQNITQERMQHAETLISEHGEEMGEECMEVFAAFKTNCGFAGGAAKKN